VIKPAVSGILVSHGARIPRYEPTASPLLRWIVVPAPSRCNGALSRWQAASGRHEPSAAKIA